MYEIPNDLPPRRYKCGHCGRGELNRSEILPPVGVMKPPGIRWRCRPCHLEILQRDLDEVMAAAIAGVVRTSEQGGID